MTSRDPICEVHPSPGKVPILRFEAISEKPKLAGARKDRVELTYGAWTHRTCFAGWLFTNRFGIFEWCFRSYLVTPTHICVVYLSPLHGVHQRDVLTSDEPYGMASPKEMLPKTTPVRYRRPFRNAPGLGPTVAPLNRPIFFMLSCDGNAHCIFQLISVFPKPWRSIQDLCGHGAGRGKSLCHIICGPTSHSAGLSEKANRRGVPSHAFFPSRRSLFFPTFAITPSLVSYVFDSPPFNNQTDVSYLSLSSFLLRFIAPPSLSVRSSIATDSLHPCHFTPRKS
ncbi:uncharacterized protein EV422DRAFT_214359 [Fimicolochytrium jonesii]|uniref:uncharacterized protein n=1 Tax=Fimicolochytrium jonesii TaxID=1396493 RepID=UPI0022FDB743|nr:uncharacterized protein EV422DRAFT_214359 [Fimicolochytrium jonesii]KAI8817738.1 hypothetical protein EV422DRAFT_214359 [Fimicolochytrium jonesii]